MEYEYILFRCKRIEGKNYIYFPILILKRMHESFYEYHRISFIPRKKLTKNIIRRLSSLNLIDYVGGFSSDDSFFDCYYYYKYYTRSIVYNYKIRL